MLMWSFLTLSTCSRSRSAILAATPTTSGRLSGSAVIQLERERGVDIKVVCFMLYKILAATPTTSGLLSGSAVIQLERRGVDIKVVCFIRYWSPPQPRQVAYRVCCDTTREERGVDIKVVCFMLYKILAATRTTSGLLSGSAVIQLERREGWILRCYVLCYIRY